MYFEESYFKGEEREGFFIKPMIKRAWAAQMEILETIDVICQRNNIEYYASSGTLLGAIRHGGYIPWDDDLDIEMKRWDYERFLKIAEKELPNEYRIASPAQDSEWSTPFARITNATEIPLKGELLQKFHGFPYQAGVDIFPVDYIPVDKTEEDMMMILLQAAYNLAFAWDKKELSEEEKMQNLETVEKVCKVRFVKEKPYGQQLWRLVDRITAMYWDMGTEAEEMSIAYTLVNNPNCKIPVSCYRQSKRVPFENTTIPIPIGYEQVLEAYYGKDYMTPKQGVADHEYPFYREQQELLAQQFKDGGVEMPEYLWE